MLLRKFNPCSLPSFDRSMRPQNYILKPFQSEVRGRVLLGASSVPVKPDHFVKTESADDYKLENLLKSGIRPDIVTKPYYVPTIDDFSAMSDMLKGEEIVDITADTATSDATTTDTTTTDTTTTTTTTTTD